MSDRDNLESESDQPPAKKAKSHYDTPSHQTQQSSQGSRNIIIKTGHHQDHLNTRHTINVIVNNNKKERQKRYREQNRDKLKQREAERRKRIQYSQSIAGPSASSKTNRIELNNEEIITAQSSSGSEKIQPSSIQRNDQAMNTVDIEKFIECVKGYPILYNRRHKFYNSIAKKTLAWEFVGKEMNESSDVLRVKWKGLKDGYTKYKRFQAGVAPSNKSYHSWCWSENLKFLDEYVINKNNSKYKNAQTSETSSPSPPRQSPTPSADDNDLRENIESAQWTVSPAIQYESYGSRRSLSVTDEEYDPKRQKVLDPVDHLFTSYAGTFRKFSLKTQCMIKVKMAKIFADAELAEFESVHTNVSEVLLNVSNDNSIDSSQFTKIKIEKADL